MIPFLIALSGLMTVIAVLPYLREIIHGTTKPRVISWFVWSVLNGIACAASFADGHIPSGVLMLAATIETSAVVVLGFKHGDRKLETLDIGCLIGAMAGLLLWMIFDSPALAVLAAITIDLIGAIPTVRHSWLKPHEETWITYALSGIAGGITATVAGEWAITAIAYPLYLLVTYAALSWIILASPHRKLKGEPAELRRL